MGSEVSLRRSATLVLVSLLLPACGAPSADGPGDAVVVRDSAGVTIRTYPAGEFSDTIAGDPFFTVGEEGRPDYEFFQLRTALPLATGGVVVANGGTHELRFYDAEGAHLRTVGRQGNGPAEFGFLTTAWLEAGDTVVVLDPRRRRLVRFDGEGEFVDGISFAEATDRGPPPYEAPCFTPGLAGRLADGTFVTRGWGCMLFEGDSGIRPDLTGLMLAGSERFDTLGVFTAARVWERGGATDPREMYSLIPFGAALRTVVGPRRIFVSEGLALQVKVFGPDAELETILREDMLPPRVTEADRDRYIASRADTRSPHPEDVPFPERFGSYERLILSHEGDLWAQRRARPGTTRGEWVVFDSAGESIRRLILPEMRVTAIRDGKVYGYTTNDLGIQTVVAYDVDS